MIFKFWKSINYFKQKEFDSSDEPGSGVKMDKDFLHILNKIRHEAGIKFKVKSGYRTKKHNKKVGGKANSAHLRGLAADIRARNSVNRYKIISAGIKFHIRRIGVAKTFIHLDSDLSLPQKVFWIY